MKKLFFTLLSLLPLTLVAQNATIKIDVNRKISDIDPKIYGVFMEPIHFNGRRMGLPDSVDFNTLYGNLYDPSSPLADADGFRKDYIDAMKELKITNMRWPGGNFLMGYDWKDGIGPKEQRPTRINLAWGGIDNNHVGTDDWMKLNKSIGSENILAVNLGLGTILDAAYLVEYCNYKSGTYYSDLNNAGKVFLFRNKHDGTFEEVSAKSGLDKVAFAMGSNYGDIDNDGYLDFYLGTGNPSFKSAVPNKLFKNINGKRFLDVTTSARVGNIQKGHEVSFVDLDNDGDEDIYIKMGGAYVGDAYENSLYLNPGQNNNHWINILLEGTVSNKVAIGAKIKVTFRENNVERSVYRDVNSGGSFGANPLQQHIGVGSANLIETIEVTWPVTGKTQVFKNIPVDKNIKIKEDDSTFSAFKLARFDFTKKR